MSDDGERSIPGRVAAYDAIITLAINEANTSDSRGWSYGSDIETSEVVSAVEQDVSERTVLRALKDAAAMGWVEDKRQGWDVGKRAECFQPATNDDDQTPPV